MQHTHTQSFYALARAKWQQWATANNNNTVSMTFTSETNGGKHSTQEGRAMRSSTSSTSGAVLHFLWCCNIFDVSRIQVIHLSTKYMNHRWPTYRSPTIFFHARKFVFHKTCQNAKCAQYVAFECLAKTRRNWMLLDEKVIKPKNGFVLCSQT